MPPIIGITNSRITAAGGLPAEGLPHAYVRAIVDAGGVPVLLPSLLADGGWEELYPHLDGVLFAGGGDIEPGRFAGEVHPRIYDVDPSRDALELGLLRAAVEDGKPFLGICRGCQLVNVGLGGTLYTHIADQLPGALDHDHPLDLRTVLVHEVQLDQGTHIAEVLSEPAVAVNSHHHQGLKDIGAGLRVAGRSRDGLVEAIELPEHPFAVAVQWHPEWLTDQPAMRSLFRRFVGSAAQH